ncbi:pleckstrin homology domain-containing family A member 8-like isoform X2 [Clavelina lepadiformis]|uniref:pleckstrin homology domain-containing family A member 8-like isoform X2 n=1 Tax=Clavelina lepadiformis TaxID=159417 RepID=UPI004042D637
MEGNLLKWGGYLTGYTTKYFVLYRGTLSYYSSKKERLAGSSAVEHLNIGLCEIAVDTHAHSQWELRMPLESKVWYLKTSVPGERQKWIQALGSAKACLLDTSSLSRSSITSLPDDTNDVLSSHTVPTSAQDTLANKLVTVKDYACTDHSLDSAVYAISNEKSNDPKQGSHSLNDHFLPANHSDGDVQDDAANTKYTIESLLLSCSCAKDSISKLEEVIQKKDDLEPVLELAENALKGVICQIGTIKLQKSKQIRPVESVAMHDFSENSILDEVVPSNEKNLIPAELFLNACQCYLEFFDRFAGTVLAPIKTDIQGNINKIRKVMNTKPDEYLQDLLENEMLAKKHTGPDTATQALLWLTRALSVMCQFLKNLLTPGSENCRDPPAAFWAAYVSRLQKHHNWVVQRLFKMGIKMLADFERFAEDMTEKDSYEKIAQSTSSTWKNVIQEKVIEHGLDYCDGMNEIVEKLCMMYKSYKMEV